MCVKTGAPSPKGRFRPMKSGLFDFDARPSFWIETEKDFGRNGIDGEENVSPCESRRTHILSKYARKVREFEIVIAGWNFDAHGLCESKSALSVSYNKLFSVRGTIQEAPLCFYYNKSASTVPNRPFPSKDGQSRVSGTNRVQALSSMRSAAVSSGSESEHDMNSNITARSNRRVTARWNRARPLPSSRR